MPSNFQFWVVGPCRKDGVPLEVVNLVSGTDDVNPGFQDRDVIHSPRVEKSSI